MLFPGVISRTYVRSQNESILFLIFLVLNVKQCSLSEKLSEIYTVHIANNQKPRIG